MQAKLYQITPYNLTDNNFYNFTDHQKFRNFIDKIEKPIKKDVSIVKLESYNKIMYQIKFDNTKTNEEKLYCGIKYMIVDDKYWFITNFEVKKNNNQGFITYYAQLDHWASQWLTVKNHFHQENKNKAVYVERMHQTRYVTDYVKKEEWISNLPSKTKIFKYIGDDIDYNNFFESYNISKSEDRTIYIGFNEWSYSGSNKVYNAKDIVKYITKNKVYIDIPNQKNIIEDKKDSIKLWINFYSNSPFHQEEKIQINNYYPTDTIILKSVDKKENESPKKNKLNKVYYFLRLQLNKPYTLSSYQTTSDLIDFSYNYIFIPIVENNINYLEKFNPEFMTVFAVLDKKIDISKFRTIKGHNWEREYFDKNEFTVNEQEYYLFDIDFYKLMNKTVTNLYDVVDIEDINLLMYELKDIKYRKKDPILKIYPYSKYIYNKGNNFKEYKINELLYTNNKITTKIKMKYFTSIIYNIYSIWIYPECGIYNNIKEREFIPFAMNITNNLEIPTTSNSYITYAQSNLNTLQTNINQAEMTRKISNQESTISLITSAVTTAVGVALAPITMGASLGLAAVGAVNIGIKTNKWINNRIKNDFPVDSLNAKISDMKNTPNMISSTNNDYFWLTYFNNSDYFDRNKNDYNEPIDLINDYSVSRFFVSSITPNEQEILDDWYYFNGYLCNKYLNNINFNENRNRYIFNFYKIKEIKTLLSNCPEICNEDIEWWNNTFNQGIIIWESEDSLKLYDETIYIGNNKYENWEINLLKKIIEYEVINI